MNSDLEGKTIHERAALLAAEYFEAVDHYRNGLAHDVGKTLAPCLVAVGAVDRATALEVGRWAVWVEAPATARSAREIRRQYIAGR